jgi:hypothetical protein
MPPLVGKGSRSYHSRPAALHATTRTHPPTGTDTNPTSRPLRTLRCVQPPALSIFQTSLKQGKFDESRKLANGGMMEFAHVYPMDAVFDTPEDVPPDVSCAGWIMH